MKTTLEIIQNRFDRLSDCELCDIKGGTAIGFALVDKMFDYGFFMFSLPLLVA